MTDVQLKFFSAHNAEKGRDALEGVPDRDVRLHLGQYDALAGVAVYGTAFAARFAQVITDMRHRRFVAEGVADDYAMPFFEKLLPELDLMRRMGAAFDPQAVRVDLHCDAFVHVKIRAAVGFAYACLQAQRVVQATLQVVQGTDYVAYHRLRADMGEGYRGPSAVPQWRVFYPAVREARGTAQRLGAMLAQAAPAVARGLPQAQAYIGQALPPAVAAGSRAQMVLQ